MSDADLEPIEAQLNARTIAHRAFFVPIVRAIAALGGRARKRDVVKQLRQMLAEQFSEKQLDYLEQNNRFGCARVDLRSAEIVAGEYGYWEQCGNEPHPWNRSCNK